MVSVSGVRGTIGGTLTPHVAMEFGLAYGTMLHRRGGVAGGNASAGGAASTKKPSVVIGRDTRPSGAMIASAVAAGLLATGIDVIDLGIVTTPGTAFMASRLGCAGGVIITASHNPPPYNGIKFLQPNGCCLPAAEANELADIWRQGQFDVKDFAGVGSQTRNGTTHGLHADAVAAIVDVKLIASKRFKVVLDSINGAGCVVSPMLLGRLGAELAHLNAEPNGQFAHEPEPIQKNLTSLCEAVRRHKAAVGFAQDPDADRLVVVDELGNFIGEEYTLALATAFVLRHRKGDVATNLATSRMIDEIAAAAGVAVRRAPTGEANVVETMLRDGCIFGGEGNGGVIEPRVVLTRSSLVGMAYILQSMAETGKPLSELAAEIPSYVFLKTKFPCPAGVAPAVAERAKALFTNHPAAMFDERDGLRVDLPEGWVSVRASNTEPIMRIMAEARTEDVAQGLVDRVRKVADEVIGQ